ncbi:putative 54S ribosomal protein [Clavispora lusitaniae]|uniref:54S ribosomal protein n=1 Tax=Clavispora lusitaniae TaxID=36911 RepID=A0ACD0WP88_CLALS|nr:putative 54S ribosomal protein [Clavispora lusitaniae]QFZ34879.1 putative 54S ribosomal protein [Clavispora lusitaniae]QFZ40564.1 putative 54S ribosomal protein [Clavispora lusitaniae]QFZ46244.1 putative 54S ribosomal protein [Clavispora lusitaniae]QFZ51906.1 putative 54S ribosomal protein [Clavispora lusitaniae]
MLGLGRSLLSSFSTFRTPQPLFTRSPLQSVFNTTLKRYKHEYAPRYKRVRKAMKGRVTVRTGGSIKGNSLEFGEYGLRLKSNGIRMTATQLKEADKVISREIRPSGASLITRFTCNVAVCIKGNQTRMGKGKGPFDHWMCRVPTGKVLFEIRGKIHDKVAREALRKASEKLPGLFEIIDRNSKIRVSPTSLVDKPEPVNYVEEMNKTPTKKWTNIQTAKLPEYRLYRGR